MANAALCWSDYFRIKDRVNLEYIICAQDEIYFSRINVLFIDTNKGN